MSKVTALVFVAAFAVGCADGMPEPTSPIVLPVLTHSAGGSAMSNGGNFGTQLTGAAERPEPRDTRARGNSIFQLNADGTELSYRLIAANIENVFMAHIHMGPAEGTGGVVVWLYPSTTPGAGPMGQGRVDGVLATGTIRAEHLVGALAGQPLSALVEQMKAGNTYVNVHTNDGVAPANTGPGDFPGGEIRGQIDHRGH